MRRLAALTALSFLFLCSCHRAGALPPDEVLRRATAASAQLQSVAYDVNISLSLQSTIMTIDGTAALKGTLAHGGQEAAFTLTADGTMTRTGGAKNTLQMNVDVVSEPQDSYFLMHSLSMNPLPPILNNSQSLLNTWWKIPRDAGKLPLQQLTPDPQFLRAEAAVVTVLQDHGLETVNGADAYHYSVSIAPEKLIALMQADAESRGAPFDATRATAELSQYDAKGELWIDAKSFVVHKLSWSVVTLQGSPAFHLIFSADLKDHNAAQTIAVPDTAKTFSQEQLMEQILGGQTASGAQLLPH